MPTAAPVKQTSPTFDPSTAVTTLASLRRARSRFNASVVTSLATNDITDLSGTALRDAMRKGLGRNRPVFKTTAVEAIVLAELCRQDDGGSLATRGVLTMADQAAIAADVLDKTTTAVNLARERFDAACEQAVTEAKKRVGQLTDYNARLTTSLNNLNKTLGDERMGRALQNADKLAEALTLLDALEKSGSLAKVMAALAPR